ncbi:hypothetical protein B0T20DRAFT_86591 [Sordaria brevicollis]|uniref:DUF7707 domain-containing protein n=1 Tax=Sordaria brevicollis TaxID=83679 RepID=A0AAE0U345_SORBR|nr:hypothetical protein B0T20DRAFT_86591 [Sordaria brevicollis]
MRQNIIFVALSALTAAVAAQSSDSNLTVPVGSVPEAERNQWCVAQYNTCKILCNKLVKTNECDFKTLDYQCTCTSGDTPDLEKFTQTVPTFMCLTAYSTCIDQHADDARGQDKCKEDIFDKCGTQDPNKAETVKTTSSAAPSTTAAKPTETKGAAAEESSAAAAPATTSSESFAAPTNAAAFLGNGVAAVAAGVFAAALL